LGNQPISFESVSQSKEIEGGLTFPKDFDILNP
jgi:hypothetical protein